MKMLPDLSQLTHEQLLEFTQQLAMQHQSLAQSNQELEKSNQQLDAKVQHLSILTQKYEHELALFKQHKFGSKNEHLTAKQIHLWEHTKPQSTNLNVDCCPIIYTPSVSSMNQHQPNVLVAAPCVVSAKISVKNYISDRHSSIRNSMCVANGSVISVTH